MLNLTRKVGEVILIGDDISIVVTAVKGSSVTFSVQAPRHISVDRKEIRMRKEQSKNTISLARQNLNAAKNSNQQLHKQGKM